MSILKINKEEVVEKQMKVAVDARMYKDSGIGTYIQNLIKTNCYSIALRKKRKLK